MYRSASGLSDTEVHFFDDSDTVTIHRGGSLSWRTHNPGLLGLGPVAQDHGAIGIAQGVPVFPSLEHGRRALRDWLGRAETRHLSIASLYRRVDPDWQLPPSHPARPSHCPDTGLEAERPVSSLSPRERDTVAHAIEHRLGMEIGSVHCQPLATQEDSATPATSGAGGNIAINGRSAVHAGSQGLLTSIDVCLTRIGKRCKPIPYTNVAESRDATGTAGSVFVNGHAVCHHQSRFARSRGDEAGNCGGVRSRTRRGYAEFVGSSGNVFFEGVPAVRQFDPMVSNCRNTPPASLMQPGCRQAQELNPAVFNEPPPLQQTHGLRLEVDLDRALGRGLEVTAHPRDGSDDAVGAYPHPVNNRRDAHTLLFTGLPAQTVDLMLPLHDPHQGMYHVPLARDVSVRPRDADNDPTLEAYRHEHQLVAVALRRPLDLRGIEHDVIRPGCRVYVFRDGHLWRELEAGPEGTWLEVNLEVWQGEDERPAHCPVGARLLFPHRIDGKVFDYQLALSEPQWTWARIQAFGGLAPDDPRRAPRPSSGGQDVTPIRYSGSLDTRCIPLNLGREAVRRGRLGRAGEPGGRPRPLLASQPEPAEALELRDVNGLITALLPDPLQQARDLRQSMDACLEDLAEAEQSAIDGERALGTLIQLLIEVQPDLQRQVDVPRMNRTLNAWDQKVKEAASRFQSLNRDLLSLLQSPHYAHALEDYTESPCPDDRVFGLLQWIHCIRDLDSETALPYLRCFLDPETNTLPILGNDDPETRQTLIDWSTGTQWLDTTEPRMKPLMEIDRLQLATFAPDALNRLIDALAEAAMDEQSQHIRHGLDNVATLAHRIAGIELHVQHLPLSSFLGFTLDKPPTRGFQLRQSEFIDIHKELHQVHVPVLMPTGAYSLGDLSRMIHNNPSYRTAYGATLGPLLLFNLGLALGEMGRSQTVAHNLQLASLFSTVAAFGLSEFRFWSNTRQSLLPQYSAPNITQPNQSGYSHNISRQRIKSSISNHRAHKRRQRNYQASGQQTILITLTRFSGLMDIGAGATYIFDGLTKDNRGVILGGALIVASGVAILGANILGFSALTALLLGTMGNLVVANQDRTKIAQSLFESKFGKSAKKEINPKSCTLSATEDQLKKIISIIHEIHAQIIMHDLTTQKNAHNIQTHTGPILREPDSPVLIEINIQLTEIASFRGAIEVEISLRSTGSQIQIAEMMVIETDSHEAPVKIRLFHKTTIRAIVAGVNAKIILRPNRNEPDFKIDTQASWPSRNSRNNRLSEEEYLRIQSTWRPTAELTPITKNTASTN
ncbi:DUF4150 domain-containing protein [Ectothiorhodospira haloalkaliphila]|uniref:PAAR-like domain-containing protein n=1 Tax=Ectothiorhodospira haloalkaliphila TaxID=421628 RepID=UPI001EE9984D|nr:PAAR-like domain-containing protein [Ectothiorhodospira haloalkaliphila]MCG5525669.1 DUF4150 domain-containing protein [Ectothiorhodospira haloalkaliphila]